MQSVSIEREPPLRHIRLDTGPRNVLGPAAVGALRDALSADAEAPVAVLHGRPDGFCAGLDGRVLAGDAADRESLLAAMGGLLLELFRGPTRLVTVCEGHAVAAGAMLLLVADLRLGVPGGYRVGFTEPSLGMPLPALPIRLARERLDRRRLHALTVLGEVVGPREAVEAGFLDRLVERSALSAQIDRAARALAALDEAVYREGVDGLRQEAIARLEPLVEAQARRAEAARAGDRAIPDATT